jgi:MoaA/NifB/PqqE/SkfB family radical SAM enzyme
MIERQWPRVQAVLGGQIVPPFEILIHGSSACNLRCVWCIGDHVPTQVKRADGTILFLDAAKTNPLRLPDNLGGVEVMTRMIQDIIDYQRTATFELDGQTISEEFRVEAVSFSGLIGEPLVHRAAIMAAMELLIPAGRRTGIFTNGILMDDSTWGTLVHAGYVHLSLDASNGATYGNLKFGALRGGDLRFEQALSNLTSLVKLKAATPGATVDINASFIMYPENYREVYEAARILKDVGVECFRIKQDNSGQRPLDDDQRREAVELLDRIDRDLVDGHFRLVRIHRFGDVNETERRFPRCTITDLMAAIGSDGNLYPCNYHPRVGGANYGSAIENSFAEIWEGDRRMELRKQLPSICPAVCDPFKNRSNMLLHTVREAYEGGGLASATAFKDEALELHREHQQVN